VRVWNNNSYQKSPRCRVLTETLYCENPLRQSLLEIASTDKEEGGFGWPPVYLEQTRVIQAGAFAPLWIRLAWDRHPSKNQKTQLGLIETLGFGGVGGGRSPGKTVTVVPCATPRAQVASLVSLAFQGGIQIPSLADHPLGDGCLREWNGGWDVMRVRDKTLSFFLSPLSVFYQKMPSPDDSGDGRIQSRDGLCLVPCVRDDPVTPEGRQRLPIGPHRSQRTIIQGSSLPQKGGGSSWEKRDWID